MLRRKIEKQIKEHLETQQDRILIVEGARQIGKTYIVTSANLNRWLDENAGRTIII